MKRSLSLLFSFVLFVGACSPIAPIENPFQAPAGGNVRPVAVSSLRILALDVGQGDATLVTGPTGRALLIDGGPPGAGKAKVLPAVAAEGVESLDWIVATHYDADHIGGLPEILAALPVGAVIDRGDFTDKATPAYEGYREAVSSPRKTAEAGQALDLGAGAEARIVVANGRYADGRSLHLNPDEENEASIGLLIRYGDFSYFTAGDLPGGGSPGGYETKDLETSAGNIIGDVSVLHAGHHGSASSTNDRFLDETDPEDVLISVGRDNDYGHPAESVLGRLEARGIGVHRTDLDGDILLTTDGETYELTPF